MQLPYFASCEGYFLPTIMTCTPADEKTDYCLKNGGVSGIICIRCGPTARQESPEAVQMNMVPRVLSDCLLI